MTLLIGLSPFGGIISSIPVSADSAVGGNDAADSESTATVVPNENTWYYGEVDNSDDEYDYYTIDINADETVKIEVVAPQTDSLDFSYRLNGTTYSPYFIQYGNTYTFTADNLNTTSEKPLFLMFRNSHSPVDYEYCFKVNHIYNMTSAQNPNPCVPVVPTVSVYGNTEGTSIMWDISFVNLTNDTEVTLNYSVTHDSEFQESNSISWTAQSNYGSEAIESDFVTAGEWCLDVTLWQHDQSQHVSDSLCITIEDTASSDPFFYAHVVVDENGDAHGHFNITHSDSWSVQWGILSLTVDPVEPEWNWTRGWWDTDGINGGMGSFWGTYDNDSSTEELVQYGALSDNGCYVLVAALYDGAGGSDYLVSTYHSNFQLGEGNDGDCEWWGESGTDSSEDNNTTQASEHNSCNLKDWSNSTYKDAVDDPGNEIPPNTVPIPNDIENGNGPYSMQLSNYPDTWNLQQGYKGILGPTQTSHGWVTPLGNSFWIWDSSQLYGGSYTFVRPVYLPADAYDIEARIRFAVDDYYTLYVQQGDAGISQKIDSAYFSLTKPTNSQQLIDYWINDVSPGINYFIFDAYNQQGGAFTQEGGLMFQIDLTYCRGLNTASNCDKETDLLVTDVYTSEESTTSYRAYNTNDPWSSGTQTPGIDSSWGSIPSGNGQYLWPLVPGEAGDAQLWHGDSRYQQGTWDFRAQFQVPANAYDVSAEFFGITDNRFMHSPYSVLGSDSIVIIESGTPTPALPAWSLGYDSFDDLESNSGNRGLGSLPDAGSTADDYDLLITARNRVSSTNEPTVGMLQYELIVKYCQEKVQALEDAIDPEFSGIPGFGVASMMIATTFAAITLGRRRDAKSTDL